MRELESASEVLVWMNENGSKRQARVFRIEDSMP